MIAIRATLFIQVAFADLLRVPLPRGLLDRILVRHGGLDRGAELLADPYVIFLIIAACAVRLFVGAIPGLTAAMAIALLVPVTFFMEPVPALAMIVTTSAMAIFAGDIPGALLRIPGTPASAAYADEAYAMTQGSGRSRARRGRRFLGDRRDFRHHRARHLGADARRGGACEFSSFEYFWLVCLGLTCGVFVASGSQAKAGRLAADRAARRHDRDGEPGRVSALSFGSVDLSAGIDMIPAMIGMFAIAEILRVVSQANSIFRRSTYRTVRSSRANGCCASAIRSNGCAARRSGP